MNDNVNGAVIVVHLLKQFSQFLLYLTRKVSDHLSSNTVLRPLHGPSVQPRQTSRSTKPLSSFSKLQPVHLMNILWAIGSCRHLDQNNELGPQIHLNWQLQYYTHHCVYYLSAIFRFHRRLSRPGWLVTHRNGLPGRQQSFIQVPTGFSAE